jgi:amidase
VLCPAFGTPAFPHSRRARLAQAVATDVDGEPANFGAQLGWAGIATVANLPSTAIPLGLSTSHGLPHRPCRRSGRFLDDKTTIAFAGMVGREIEPPALAE